MGKLLPARDNDVWFEASNNIMAQINPDRFIKAYRCEWLLTLCSVCLAVMAAGVYFVHAIVMVHQLR